MKKTARGCFIVAAVLAVIMALLVSIGRLQGESVRERPPLTRQELETLGQEWLKAAPFAEQPETTPTDIDQPSAEVPQAARDLPRRLARVATSEERREYFAGARPIGSELFALAISSPLGDAACIGASLMGEDADLIRGDVSLARGDWEMARRCFSEVLRRNKDPQTRQIVCGWLAWLEDDPETAARYMELACAEGISTPRVHRARLNHCAWLAKWTGSTELAEHYRARADAELAEQEKRQ